MSIESWVIHHLLVKYFQNGIISQKFLTNFVHSNHYFFPSVTWHHKGFSVLAHCLSSDSYQTSREGITSFRLSCLQSITQFLKSDSWMFAIQNSSERKSVVRRHWRKVILASWFTLWHLGQICPFLTGGSQFCIWSWIGA